MVRGEIMQVVTERGIEERRADRVVVVRGREVWLPELRGAETFAIAADGTVKVIEGRGARCAACAAWLKNEGVECATLLKQRGPFGVDVYQVNAGGE